MHLACTVKVALGSWPQQQAVLTLCGVLTYQAQQVWVACSDV